uniref:M23 family metallopeptidase n=1 Tax=Cupriavidus taiwanensis TaxID=164546 RepID=UPI001F11F5AE|nr:M23 family metallopeptidase [Cupriavidus taiwanensis]
MSGGEPGDGGYPVSYNLGWHGGVHLQAPARGNAGMEPVRAIADGVVVYRRGSSEPPEAPAPDSPLNYGGRTSDGVVVIRHETEIGAAFQQNTPTRVIFFSIYMHLHTVRSTVRQGRPILRKDELGQAGYIKGQPGKVHFEIICDDVNLLKFIGRRSGLVSQSSDGRSDVVFGEVYFCLSETARVHPRRPPLNQPEPSDGSLLGEKLFVGLRYAEGDGTQFTRGHAYVTTYRQTGAPLGAALVEPDAEYNLYRDANDICDAYPGNARPAPSAVYELLRFGRIVGPDPLVPADVPHWRKIRTPAGTGWVNLNAQGVRKFSDADFPQWRGWQLIEDAADGNSLCNASEILGPVDFNRDGSIAADEAHTRLVAPEVRAFLRRLICKFPTEWDATVIDARWGWLKTRSSANQNPMTDRQFDRLRGHIEALAFWQEANLQVPQLHADGHTIGSEALARTHWHFDPREFVRIFRKCGWISPLEFSLVYPDAYQKKTGSRLDTARDALSHEVRERYRIQLNKVVRKYHVNASSYRLAHFLGQGAEESRTLTLMFERRSESSCNQLYSGRLGNDLPGDAFRFRGRGMKQLTGKYNYTEYWLYRGWIARESFDRSWWERRGAVRRPVINNPDVLGTDDYAVIDAGGWYWVASPHRGEPHMLSSINRMVNSGRPTRENVRVVTRAINGGETGLDNREFHTDRIYRAVGDEVY